MSYDHYPTSSVDDPLRSETISADIRSVTDVPCPSGVDLSLLL